MKEFIFKLKNAPNFRMIGKVTKDKVEESQRALGVKFSQDYYNYLQEFGAAASFGHELTGICDFPRLNVVDVTNEERELNPQVPKDLYVIEQANIDGIVIWQSSSGEIYQSMPGNNVIKIADSLSDYIDKY